MGFYRLNEDDIVTRNKARMVAESYSQEERIDLWWDLYSGCKVWSNQDVLSIRYTVQLQSISNKFERAFLNGYLEEDVYVEQPIDLKTRNLKILYTSYSNLSMASKKPLEHGMRLSTSFC